MISKRAGTVWLLAAIALSASACNDGGGLHSGVAGDKALEDLSSKEIQKICDAANAFIDAALPPDLIARAACSQQALQSGDLETCQATMQLCLDALADAGTSASFSVGLPQQLGDLQCFTSTELASCKASVAELEGCLQNTFAAQSRALHAASCEALAGERVHVVDSASSPVCAALNKKCPGLASFSRRAEVPENPITNPPIGPTTPPVVGSSDCADLDLAYDGSDCASASCSRNVQCPCSSFSMSFGVCNSVQGCLSSLDCDVACNFVGSVYSCAQQSTCESDSDCGEFYCVTSGSRGTCSRGKGGDTCVDDQDCGSSDCQNDPNLGSLRCKGAASTGTNCSSDFECASGICALQPSTGTQRCSDGENGDPCSDSNDCQSKACVYSGSGYMCSDRATGSPCSSDNDCTSGRCAQGGRSASSCVEGMPGDACDSGSDCVSGRCVTSQTSFQSSCGYQPGDFCPLGVADCNGGCSVVQKSCGSADCSPKCGGGSCSSATLATWSTTDKSSSVTVSNGDLTAMASSYQVAVRATVGKSTGRWYWEVTADTTSSGYANVGVLTMTALLDYGIGNSSIAPGVGLSSSGSLSSSNGNSVTACAFSSGSVIGVALDLTSHMIYFSVNGLWQAGGDPSTSTGGIALGNSGETIHPAVSLGVGDVLTVNFGQSAFTNAPPSGFEAVAE